MEAAAEFPAAHFVNPQPPPLGAELRRHLVQPDHAMRDAVQREVILMFGQVIEQEGGGAVAREVVLQRHDLAPVTQAALRQQADVGQAVEHDTCRAARVRARP